MIAIILTDMGHSRDDKAASHERIVGIAAARIRESGIDGPGVAEIMRAAGLTHGGFYKHFGSRDELIEEAVARALSENEEAASELIASAVAAAEGDPLPAFADWYLTAAHRDNPGTGCGVAALGPDIARAGGAAQEAYGAQVERYIGHLRTINGGDDAKALVTLSTIVGALVIARGLGPTERSDELLSAVRDAIRERRSVAG
jgi:TetR/AcrR family transcriptional regulator, transcriptional repressor for nem operon